MGISATGRPFHAQPVSSHVVEAGISTSHISCSLIAETAAETSRLHDVGGAHRLLHQGVPGLKQASICRE